MQNPASIVISRPSGFGPSVDVKLFHACQKQLEERGKTQRGISRRRDPARYPLALRVWDMTLGCGHPMYATTSGSRVLYTCGRYMKTAGAECEHNAVDGEAALGFVLNVLTQQIERLGGREALRARLLKLAAAEADPDSNVAVKQEMQHVEQRLDVVEGELKLIGRNLARARDEAESEIIRAEWTTQKAEVERTRRQLESLQRQAWEQPASHPAAQVDLALSLYGDLQAVVQDPTARSAIPSLLEKINLRLWLHFAEGTKGKRKVRVLAGGILTTGDAEPPVRPYGSGNDSGGSSQGRSSPGMVPVAAGVNKTPSVSLFGQPEGVSFTKVNRGDRI